MSSKITKKETDLLLEALLQMSNKEDMLLLLKDLLTETEILEFTQRLDIAKRLQKRDSYKKIETETGASSTTIARVAKFLQGENGGYRKVFEDKK